MTRHQVLDAMKLGAKLHRQNTEEGAIYWLIISKPVQRDVADRMIDRGDLVSAGDTLFEMTRSQTYVLAA